MKKIALLSLAVMTIPAVAVAQDSDKLLPGEFSGNVGIVSDYTFRGISQTNEKAALQGGIDWEHDSGFYAGVWGSNVDFNEAPPVSGASAEIDVYGGWGQSIGAFSYSIGGAFYAYPGADAALNYNFTEVSLSAGYELMEGLEVGALYAFSPDFYTGADNAHYVEGNIGYSFDLGLPVSLGATVGHQSIENNTRFGAPDYMNWSATAAVTVDNIELGVSYRDTDLSKAECFAGSDWCDARAVAFVGYSF